jgi:hypothetical protein
MNPQLFSYQCTYITMHHDQGRNAAIELQTPATMTTTPTTMAITATTASIVTATAASLLIPFRYWYRYRIFVILIYSLLSSMKYIAQTGNDNRRRVQADIVLSKALTLEATTMRITASPATVISASAFFLPSLPTTFVAENTTSERGSPPEKSSTSSTSTLPLPSTEIVPTEPILPMVIEDLLRTQAGIRITDRADFRKVRATGNDQSLSSCLMVMVSVHCWQPIVSKT